MSLQGWSCRRRGQPRVLRGSHLRMKVWGGCLRQAQMPLGAAIKSRDDLGSVGDQDLERGMRENRPVRRVAPKSGRRFSDKATRHVEWASARTEKVGTTFSGRLAGERPQEDRHPSRSRDAAMGDFSHIPTGRGGFGPRRRSVPLVVITPRRGPRLARAQIHSRRARNLIPHRPYEGGATPKSRRTPQSGLRVPNISAERRAPPPAVSPPVPGSPRRFPRTASKTACPGARRAAASVRRPALRAHEGRYGRRRLLSSG